MTFGPGLQFERARLIKDSNFTSVVADQPNGDGQVNGIEGDSEASWTELTATATRLLSQLIRITVPTLSTPVRHILPRDYGGTDELDGLAPLAMDVGTGYQEFTNRRSDYQ